VIKTPAPYRKIITNLVKTFEKCIGRRGPIDWPYKINGFEHNGFLFLGSSKKIAYGKKSDNLEELRRNISSSLKKYYQNY